MPPTKRIYKGATTLFTLPGVRYYSTHTVVEESFLLQLLKLILFSVRQHGIYPAGDHGPGCHLLPEMTALESREGISERKGISSGVQQSWNI